MTTLRRSRRRSDHEWIGLALRHVLGRSEADEGRRIVAHIIRNREQLESRQRPKDHVDLVALNQLLRLGFRPCGTAAGVGGDYLDVAGGQGVVLFLEKGSEALLHLDATLSERSALDSEQADLEGRRLRDSWGGKAKRRRGGANGASHEGATV